MDTYFVIHTSEDGDVSIHAVSKDELLKRISVDAGGTNYYGTKGFMSEIDDPDPMMHDNDKLLIIKGQIVVPQPKQTVTEWEI